MKIQSLSIVVPSNCYNRCRFCVAHMTDNDYTNQIENNKRFQNLYKRDYKKRLAFARDNGCNTMMITGNGEPLLNMDFLANLGEWNSTLPNPFRWIEFQTSGTGLDDEKLRFLRNTVGVNTISLSLSALHTLDNALINRTPDKYVVMVGQLCDEIKRYDFNLRLSLNLTDFFNELDTKDIFLKCANYGADQLTFRVLYESGLGQEEDNFVKNHSASKETIHNIREYIVNNGTPLNKLPYGTTKYSVHGMSVVLDSDCMAKDVGEDYKYLVLQPDCKLYSSWDDKASLIF